MQYYFTELSNYIVPYFVVRIHCSISTVLTYLVAVSEGLEKSDLTTDQENDYDIPKTTI